MISKEINIAITDDHLLVLSGIADLLKDELNVKIVGQYTNAASTKKGLEIDLPDILILDINLPDGSGIDLAKELLNKHASLKIIMLTSFENVTFVKQVMRIGAKGYLPKSITKTELVSAIEKVSNGELFLHSKIKELLLKDSIGNPSNSSFIPSLTRREKQVLQSIMEERTTAEIADKLNISVKTVETHRAHLFQKLNVRNIAGLVKVAIERGVL